MGERFGTTDDSLTLRSKDAPIFHGKPILGIAGGIGSGKSYVAKLFEPHGWLVINSDEIGREVYGQSHIRKTLREWWGESVFDADGKPQRSAIAKLIFQNAGERARLEALIHPAVNKLRDERMTAAVADPQTVGFVWDTPLLFETGLSKECDWIVFIDAPAELREARVRQHRGWAAGELSRRENSQLPLDIKREMSQDVIRNTADASDVMRQVQQVLSRISEQRGVRTIRPAGGTDRTFETRS